jgi:hypothetical protein
VRRLTLHRCGFANSGNPAIRRAAETENFKREQYEQYEKIAIPLGVRQQRVAV